MPACDGFVADRVTFIEGIYESGCRTAGKDPFSGTTYYLDVTLEIHMDRLTQTLAVSTAPGCDPVTRSEQVSALLQIEGPNFGLEDVYDVKLSFDDGTVQYTIVKLTDDLLRLEEGGDSPDKRSHSLSGPILPRTGLHPCVSEIPPPPPWSWPDGAERITAQYSSYPLHAGTGLLLHDNSLFISTEQGQIHVMQRDASGTWVEQQILASRSTRLLPWGDLLFAPEPYDDANSGRVLVFRKQASGSWDLDTTLSAPTRHAWSRYGSGVAFDGTYLLIGQPEGWDFDMGLTYVYLFDGQSFAPQGTLPRINTTLTARDKLFGERVGMADGRAAVAGGGYVYFHSYDDAAGGWVMDERLDATPSTPSLPEDLLMLSGDEVLVAYRDVIHVYQHDGGSWKVADTLAFADGRRGVARLVADGDQLAVGGGLFDALPDGTASAGLVRIFERGAGGWALKHEVANPDAIFPDDQFGYGVALAGKTLLIGNPALRFPAIGNKWGMVYEFTLP